MKLFDAIFAAICGASVAWIAGDFLAAYNLEKYNLLIYVLFAILSVVCLEISYLINKNKNFIYIPQAAKYFLVGSISSVVDIKIFYISVWLISFVIISKIISFIIATCAKFWANKHWTFENHLKENIKQEFVQFFIITVTGLVINIAIFYYFDKILGAQFNMPEKIWQELCIILAAVAVAVWNFSGYKFIVFKK